MKWILIILMLPLAGCTSTWMLTEVPSAFKPSTYHPREFLKSAEYSRGKTAREDYMERVALGMPVENHHYRREVRMNQPDEFFSRPRVPHSLFGSGLDEPWKRYTYYDKRSNTWKRYDSYLEWSNR